MSNLESLINRVLCGDCTQVMKRLPDESIDLVLTDPPYLANYHDRTGRTVRGDREGSWLYPAFLEAYRVLKRDRFCISFYGWPQADKFLRAWKAVGFRPVGHVVFVKQYASRTGYLEARHEAAYLLAKGVPAEPYSPISDVRPWQYTGNKLHPTQKPESALVPLIRAFSRPGDVVLDPFAGSGSTCRAARKVGRRFIGIELERGYISEAA